MFFEKRKTATRKRMPFLYKIYKICVLTLLSESCVAESFSGLSGLIHHPITSSAFFNLHPLSAILVALWRIRSVFIGNSVTNDIWNVVAVNYTDNIISVVAQRYSCPFTVGNKQRKFLIAVVFIKKEPTKLKVIFNKNQ